MADDHTKIDDNLSCKVWMCRIDQIFIIMRCHVTVCQKECLIAQPYRKLLEASFECVMHPKRQPRKFQNLRADSVLEWAGQLSAFAYFLTFCPNSLKEMFPIPEYTVSSLMHSKGVSDETPYWFPTQIRIQIFTSPTCCLIGLVVKSLRRRFLGQGFDSRLKLWRKIHWEQYGWKYKFH